MDLLHHKMNVCDQCGEKFERYEELIGHARHVHHHTIVKCHESGKEFIHEKDRLHQWVDQRTHKWEHSRAKDPQRDVDEHMRNFGDNF